jgi:hypothetical protein
MMDLVTMIGKTCVLQTKAFFIRIMFSQWYNKGVEYSNIPDNEIILRLDTDLNQDIENTIKIIVNKYVDKYGPEKFQKEILHQLIVKWHESLYWFKRKLKFNEEYTTDENGKDIKNLRRFQLQLKINNEFRKIQSTFYKGDSWKIR